MKRYFQYFKQAWNIIRQERLFSFIYIAGTGLSITMVMVLSIVFYIKLANIYPETNRDRMLVVKSASANEKDNAWSSSLALPVIETCFGSLESAETISVGMDVWGDESYVQPDGSAEQWPVTVKYVDTGFWTVFPFRFRDGKPFTEADMQSGIRTAVIAESLARRLFGTVEATGRTVSLNFIPFRVCGVVKDASFVTTRTYAQLWVPYTVDPNYKEAHGPGNLMGNMQVYILAPSAGDVEQVRREAVENVNRFVQTLSEGLEFSIMGQPDRHWQSSFRTWSSVEPEFNMILLYNGFIFFVLLLVPAVSLSGMTDSRMERRMSELAVRRAFGARRRTLVMQIITENLLFTLLGGVVGLMASYLLVLAGRNWIMSIGDSFTQVLPEGAEVTLSPEMLLNLPVFAIALGICFALNLLSALVPAWHNAHREIVYSLNAK
jgi:putative ABC transport system permease protein